MLTVEGQRRGPGVNSGRRSLQKDPVYRLGQEREEILFTEVKGVPPQVRVTGS